MSFSMADALAICTANLESRKTALRTTYTLYYSNSAERYDGKIHGGTVKFLIEEFRKNKNTYKYAFITRHNDDKVLRFFNREKSSKFFSMTRTGKKSAK